MHTLYAMRLLRVENYHGNVMRPILAKLCPRPFDERFCNLAALTPRIGILRKENLPPER